MYRQHPCESSDIISSIYVQLKCHDLAPLSPPATYVAEAPPSTLRLLVFVQ